MTKPPDHKIFRYTRILAGLSQTAAGRLVYKKLRTVQDWEAGLSPIERAAHELFLLKTSDLRDQIVAKIRECEEEPIFTEQYMNEMNDE